MIWKDSWRRRRWISLAEASIVADKFRCNLFCLNWSAYKSRFSWKKERNKHTHTAFTFPISSFSLFPLGKPKLWNFYRKSRYPNKSPSAHSLLLFLHLRCQAFSAGSLLCRDQKWWSVSTTEATLLSLYYAPQLGQQPQVPRHPPNTPAPTTSNNPHRSYALSHEFWPSHEFWSRLYERNICRSL